jgi:hypothetical protein
MAVSRFIAPWCCPGGRLVDAGRKIFQRKPDGENRAAAVAPGFDVTAVGFDQFLDEREADA